MTPNSASAAMPSGSSAAATELSQRRLAIGFLNLAHALDHFVILIYPTVVIELEVTYNRSYAELIALSDALNDLYAMDERQAKVVDMKFFGGLSNPEISDVLQVSRATVERDWATARAWLHRHMTRTESP